MKLHHLFNFEHQKNLYRFIKIHKPKFNRGSNICFPTKDPFSYESMNDMSCFKIRMSYLPWWIRTFHFPNRSLNQVGENVLFLWNREAIFATNSKSSWSEQIEDVVRTPHVQTLFTRGFINTRGFNTNWCNILLPIDPLKPETKPSTNTQKYYGLQKMGVTQK